MSKGENLKPIISLDTTEDDIYLLKRIELGKAQILNGDYITEEEL